MPSPATPSGPATRQVAVLGTGIIGGPVARHLSGAFRVRAWNRTAAKAEALAAATGVTACATPAEAVEGADLVVTVLKDGPAVLDAMTEAAPALKKGAVWLQLSTVGVDAIDGLAAFAREHGLVFYDAPVQGTRQPAENAQLVILASGPADRREEAEQVFGVIGSRTVWVGDESGAGSRLKLALNSVVFALTHATAESLVLARALGVDPRLVVDVISGGPLDSTYFQLKSKAALDGDFTTSFSVANALKDARLVVEAAEAAGVTLDVAAGGARRFERLVEAGHGEEDIAASYLAD
ncbi:NAD(P)-dependent oxidoreductase [Streptomyces sp. NPDC001941]|uniref:NAD(P)-dependent oxidoreductase n=1 Tax=Streptomyces sp. NPDC001941 TaxID=3154659 RepID=UPI00332B9E5D